MKTAFINAKIYNTEKRAFEDGTLYVENGIIVAPCEVDETVDLGGACIIPGLVDVHTHGRILLRWDNVDANTAIKLAKSYAAVGTTSVMGTFGTCTCDKYVYSIDGIKAARQLQKNEALGANILGVHFEARFLNPKRGGAHERHLLSELNSEEMAGYIDRTKDGDDSVLFHLTCAPEMENGEDFVKTSISHGATVGIGHSAATYDECLDAIKWGAKSFTHLFNAMTPLAHREPGCIGAAFDTDAYTELISDGCHVVAPVMRTTYRQKAADKLVIITDSTWAAGMAPGIYGDCDTRNGKVGIWHDGVTINGSIIDMFTGLMNFKDFNNITLEEAIPYATINPARMVGADSFVGSLEVGKYADFIVLHEDYSRESVYVRGVKQ
ncbi:MAG: N-acetylglucosamine-6-phosphate deacetylase [Clostridia bacterium]|nr:N-acetylglucosamine-6-phosphate deacetylase [Clostridia bacterium]